MPSYSEIIDDTHDASDEEAVEAAEEFESTYNFRFEQAYFHYDIGGLVK